jgi:hypothetical protein
LTDPYAEVTPYATCESAPLLVFQAIVAPDAVIADAVIPERVRGATSEMLAAADEPLRVAVTVAVWSETNAPVLALNVAEVTLAAMLTEEGTLNAEGALSESVTTVLLVVGFDRVAVQVLKVLGPRVVGAQASEETSTAAERVMVVLAELPLQEAVRVAL